jgi:hypothetical protein
MKSGYAMNPQTGRIISKTTAKYKKMVKQGLIIENDDIQKVEKVKKVDVVQSESDSEPEQFDESKLQSKLADISTDMIKKNLKSIVKAQKLSDKELDTMLKKLLYKKLCIEPEPRIKKKKKKRIIESSSEESESD